ncbi:MAG: transglutaminase family protein [Verrucomicrobia bacterium]|nr:transglutaminase family protein [Verrucomicrobiota bacterium]
MRFRIAAELVYGVTGPCSFLFNVAALKNRFQHAKEESLNIEHGEAPEEFLWNDSRFHRTTGSGPELRLTYRATVDLTPDVQENRDLPVRTLAQLPKEVLIYLFPSRYCQSDSLLRFAQSEFLTSKLTGFELVTRVCNWIYEKVAYQRGATTSITSAFDTVTERQGVCRDFAHLGIALCRALGIPARFVSAYAYGLVPPDFHAVFEAYLGDRWYLFDSTRMSPQSSFVRVGMGRDAADTSFATFFGPATFKSMNVTMEADGDAKPQFVTQPISSSD